MTVPQFCDAVAVLGKKYSGSVTSWGRSEKHSKAVGGFAGDPHTWWLGVDMTYDALPPLGVLTEDAKLLGLKVLREGTHDHYQPADFPAGPVTQYPVQ